MSDGAGIRVAPVQPFDGRIDVECCGDYWLASGRYANVLVLVEAETCEEARDCWITVAAQRAHRMTMLRLALD